MRIIETEEMKRRLVDMAEDLNELCDEHAAQGIYTVGRRYRSLYDASGLRSFCGTDEGEKRRE